MLMTKPPHTALAAAKLRWAEAQHSHALRGTPSHRMTTGERSPTDTQVQKIPTKEMS